MKAISETITKITIELTEPEARWLRDLVQRQTWIHEDPYDAEMRRTIFDGLNAVTLP